MPMPDDKVPRLLGYGVRFDPDSQRYRVRNEITGEWMLQDSGELATFTFFTDAYSAWRQFEVHPRPGEER
ncbi:hypothetical protein [Kitasatospora xanthocidica]|uniref:hypothetical protein n=1 Tax=Kitasatospora xanthocidica TaxID=83382 RepID=UPI001675EBC3|nr:hypothetical protein [Kitasatospora xanthocidica]GHF82039.1 hypothetical protein GCM10018790_69690 [Kitasatospora xanthocidica]